MSPPLLLKDSLAYYRRGFTAHLKKACTTTSAKSIVITHGTDTMVNTAKRLAQLALDKTHCFNWGDDSLCFWELFRWVFLIWAVPSRFHKLFPPMFYITMQGQYFLWDEVQKNKNLGLFEKL